MQKATRKVFASLLALMLAVQCVLPMAAYARQAEVALDNHTVAAGRQKTVSGIQIADVDAPSVGGRLDDKATVTTAEGETWDIPVLWVGDDMRLATTAAEGRFYLPVLAFYVPEGLSIEGGQINVRLSEPVSALFGTHDIVSVYDASTGITYILPATLRNFFVREDSASSKARLAAVVSAIGSKDTADTYGPSPSYGAVRSRGGDGAAQGVRGVTLVDIYCSQTAKNAISREDLEWFVDLVLNYLQPQAVELLISAFPSFREAAQNNEIGRQIGLYIYFLEGDKDGVPDHEDAAPEALAYVSGKPIDVDGELKYGYMVGIDLSSLVKSDENGSPIVDPATGKVIFLRDGEGMRTFENTIIHEFFHAFMNDYNRTGMSGGTDLRDIVTKRDGNFYSDEQEEKYTETKFPSWFAEGSASAVENVYQFRRPLFELLRSERVDGEKNTLQDRYYGESLVTNYLNAKNSEGKPIYYDLEWNEVFEDANGNSLPTDPSRYVTGYLATLYLSDLAARYVYKESAVKTVDGVATVDSAMLRGGLDSLLKWSHDGVALDDLVNVLSPKDERGASIYESTQALTKKFIKGAKISENNYEGDFGEGRSVEFVLSFLNYMLDLDNAMGEDGCPNGSILFDLNSSFKSPLDPGQRSSSDYLQIADKNVCVPSTVKSDAAYIGAGTPASTATKELEPSASEAEAEAGDKAKTEGTRPEVAEAAADEVVDASPADAAGTPATDAAGTSATDAAGTSATDAPANTGAEEPLTSVSERADVADVAAEVDVAAEAGAAAEAAMANEADEAVNNEEVPEQEDLAEAA